MTDILERLKAASALNGGRALVEGNMRLAFWYPAFAPRWEDFGFPVSLFTSLNAKVEQS